MMRTHVARIHTGSCETARHVVKGMIGVAALARSFVRRTPQLAEEG
jgi:hypothetical protein